MGIDEFGRSGPRRLGAPSELSRRAALHRLAGGGLAAGLLVVAETGRVSSQATPTATDTEAVARQAIAAINQALATGDTSALEAIFAANYVDHTPRRSLTSGRLASPDLTGFAASLSELRTAFPDATLVVEDVIAATDRAAVRFTFRGTPDPSTIDLGLPTDRPLSVGGVFVVRVAGGRVTEGWEYDEFGELASTLAAQAAQAEQAATATEAPPTATPAATAAATTTEGRVTSETRDVRDFDQVALDGIGTLTIEQGDTEGLTISAESRVLERIRTEVAGGKLTIRPARSFRTREQIAYDLKVKTLSGIELTGAGRVESSALTADQLSLTVSGAGAVTITGLTATSLDVSATGNADIELAGQVEEQQVELGGSSKYRAGDLASGATTITVNSAGQAVVQVSDTLDATVGGAGSVQYIGDPTVNQNLTGAGKLTKAG